MRGVIQTSNHGIIYGNARKRKYEVADMERRNIDDQPLVRDKLKEVVMTPSKIMDI